MMLCNILDNTTELWMTKYIIGEIFSSGGATLYKNPSDQTVYSLRLEITIFQLSDYVKISNYGARIIRKIRRMAYLSDEGDAYLFTGSGPK